VNKVNTRVTLRLDLGNSGLFDDGEKEILVKKLESRINKEGILVIHEEGSRSQVKNKAVALEKLVLLIDRAFLKQKRRLPSKPSRSAVLSRLKKKKFHAEKKKFRKKVGF